MTQSTTLACQRCGASPATKVVFQAITGMILLHTVHTAKGTFCRDCGLAIKDQMNQKTLKGGWFSIGALVGMPIFLAVNAARSGRLNKLGAPERAAG